MKKTLLTSVIAALMALCATTSQAQENKFSLGGGIAYATEMKSTGIFARGIYQFNPKWDGAFSGTYYLEEGLTLLGFDADAHYAFYNNEENLSVYTLFGLNLLTLSSEYFDTTSSLGINLGVGLRYQFTEKLALVPEFKYILGTEEGGSYFGLSVGLFFSF